MCHVVAWCCVATVQSTSVMCLAAARASASASSSFTLFSTDISRGLFSAGRRLDSNLRTDKQESERRRVRAH